MADIDSTAITPKKLHGIMRGFAQTAMLRTAIELHVFDGLAGGNTDVDSLSRQVGAHPRGLRILLDSLAAIGLLRSAPDGYALLAGSEKYLLSSSNDYFGTSLKLGASDWEWDAQKRLTETVRKGGAVMDTHALTPEFDYWEDFAENTNWFNNGASEVMADELVRWAAGRDSVDVLDVACSHGYYGLNFAKAEPRARVWGLDWANVLPITARNYERNGMAERFTKLPGDMFTIDLGGPYDIVMITNVLHHFSEQTCTGLLRQLFDVTKSGGRIAVSGHTYNDGDTPEKLAPPFLFSEIMLVMTEEGETHSVQTYERMLTNAGFTSPQMFTGEQAMHTVFTADRP
ncbi:class I SAM-dependent methyltransferase [Nocardia sp. NPDC046473]|uniref:class I SAM-dependent methyltransferase n=1 Tax=Nocardia sp. NPDC046473 TaxID=3155733 RepID=UPI0033D6B220